MAISLSAEIQKLIDDRVQSGNYNTAEDVVAAALLSLDQQQAVADLSRDELEVLYPGYREKIAEGLALADAGRLTDGEEFFAELEREAKNRSGKDPRSA